MGKGSSGPSTITQTQTPQIPAWLTQAAQNYLTSLQGLAFNSPYSYLSYSPLMNPSTAPFTPNQQGGMEQLLGANQQYTGVADAGIQALLTLAMGGQPQVNFPPPITPGGVQPGGMPGIPTPVPNPTPGGVPAGGMSTEQFIQNYGPLYGLPPSQIGTPQWQSQWPPIPNPNIPGAGNAQQTPMGSAQQIIGQQQALQQAQQAQQPATPQARAAAANATLREGDFPASVVSQNIAGWAPETQQAYSGMFPQYTNAVANAQRAQQPAPQPMASAMTPQLNSFVAQQRAPGPQPVASGGGGGQSAPQITVPQQTNFAQQAMQNMPTPTAQQFSSQGVVPPPSSSVPGPPLPPLNFDPNVPNPYLDQYYKAAGDTMTKLYKNATAPSQMSAAAQAGAFGGSADAMQRALGQFQLGQNLANLGAQIYEPAWAQQQQLGYQYSQLGQQGALAQQQMGLQHQMQGEQLQAQSAMLAQQGDIQGALQAAQLAAQEQMLGQQLGAQQGMLGQQLSAEAQMQQAQLAAQQAMQGQSLAAQQALAGQQMQLQQQLASQGNQLALAQLQANTQLGALGMIPEFANMLYTPGQTSLGVGGMQQGQLQNILGNITQGAQQMQQYPYNVLGQYGQGVLSMLGPYAGQLISGTNPNAQGSKL